MVYRVSEKEIKEGKVCVLKLLGKLFVVVVGFGLFIYVMEGFEY